MSSKADGFLFDPHDGSLYVNLHELLGTVLHLTSWQDGLALFRSADLPGDAWEAVEHDLGFPLLDWSDSSARTRDTEAVSRFVEGIPPAMRELARPFAWRQYTLLRLLRAEPNVVSIVEDNPVLAWLLADRLAEAELTPSSAHDLLLGQRTEILQEAAGIRSRGAVNLLSRIRFERYEAPSLLSIRKLLDLPDLQDKLSQLRKISGSMLMSVLRRPAVLHFPVWRTLAERCNDPNSVGALAAAEAATTCIRDIELMAQQLEVHDPVAVYRACTTQESLQRLHDRWAARINRGEGADAVARIVRLFGTAVFPEPPLPGSESIRPILTQEELSDEGATMHHCVATYGERVMRGRSYIYAVHAPERATLELGVEHRNFRQLLCAHNAQPSQQSYRAVQDWLNAHGALLSTPGV